MWNSFCVPYNVQFFLICGWLIFLQFWWSSYADHAFCTYLLHGTLRTHACTHLHMHARREREREREEYKMYINSAHNTLQILEIKVKWLHSHNTHCSTRYLYLVDCPYSLKPICQFFKFIKLTVLIWILLLVDSTDIRVVGKGLMLSVHQNYVFILICCKATDS